MSRSLLSIATVAVAAPLAITLLAGGQQPAPPVFNGSQAATGATVYAASCASCHTISGVNSVLLCAVGGGCLPALTSLSHCSGSIGFASHTLPLEMFQQLNPLSKGPCLARLMNSNVAMHTGES